LLEYTLNCAEASLKISKIILSTDDEEIASTASRISTRIEIPFLRPPDLAKDDTSMISVLQDLLSKLDRDFNYRPEVVLLLQPTSPFRLPHQIDRAITLLENPISDAVVSVVKVPHNMVPNSQLRIDGQYLIPYEQKQLILRRQDKPVLYARNGPAILAVKSKSILKGEIYPPKTIMLEMDRVTSIDIDEPIDLKIAECLYPLWEKIRTDAIIK
jgi:CMP-N,N'-diacetyllegionaminic acid synthase